jgi:hypothetical protein
MTPTEIDQAFDRIRMRLDAHSRYIANEVIPELYGIREEMTRLWITEKRFRKLEQSVADLRQWKEALVRPH